MTSPFRPAKCRFCGEAEWLTLNPSFVSDHFAHEANGSLIMDGDQPRQHDVDFVECLICGALAPTDIWDGATVTPEMRAALDAYYRAPPHALTPEVAP